MNYYNEYDKFAAQWLPNRVGLLRGAGNAIVPQAAALFVETFLEEVL